RFFPGRGRVFDFERDHFHAVAVFLNVIGDFIVRQKRRGPNKRQLILSNGVTGAIFDSGLWATIGQTLKAEGAVVEMRRLLRVPDIKFDRSEEHTSELQS